MKILKTLFLVSLAGILTLPSLFQNHNSKDLLLNKANADYVGWGGGGEGVEGGGGGCEGEGECGF